MVADRVHEACTQLWENGEFPSPTKLNRILHKHSSRNLNGREVAARTAWLLANGFRKDLGRWRKVHTKRELAAARPILRRAAKRIREHGFLISRYECCYIGAVRVGAKVDAHPGGIPAHIGDGPGLRVALELLDRSAGMKGNSIPGRFAERYGFTLKHLPLNKQHSEALRILDGAIGMCKP